MVNVENVEELKKIIESNFGYLVTNDVKNIAAIHKPNCMLVTEGNFLENIKNKNIMKFHWFSSFLLAEKEFKEVTPCNRCNP